MSSFNVHISLNKRKTYFFAKITNEKSEVLKEFAEQVGSFNLKTHQKMLGKTCVDWINMEYSPISEPKENIATTTESPSGTDKI